MRGRCCFLTKRFLAASVAVLLAARGGLQAQSAPAPAPPAAAQPQVPSPATPPPAAAEPQLPTPSQAAETALQAEQQKLQAAQRLLTEAQSRGAGAPEIEQLQKEVDAAQAAVEAARKKLEAVQAAAQVTPSTTSPAKPLPAPAPADTAAQRQAEVNVAQKQLDAAQATYDAAVKERDAAGQAFQQVSADPQAAEAQKEEARQRFLRATEALKVAQEKKGALEQAATAANDQLRLATKKAELEATRKAVEQETPAAPTPAPAKTTVERVQTLDREAELSRRRAEITAEEVGVLSEDLRATEQQRAAAERQATLLLLQLQQAERVLEQLRISGAPDADVRAQSERITQIQADYQQASQAADSARRRVQEAEATLAEAQTSLARERQAAEAKQQAATDLRKAALWRVVLFVSLAALIIVVRLLVNRLVHQRMAADDERRYTLHKIISVVSWALIALLLVFVVAGGITGFGAVLGLGTLGVAYALQDIISSVAGWFVAIGGGGYRMGDRIRIGDLRGDVVDISLIRTWLMEIGPANESGQSTGCLVSFPNNMLLKQPLYNFTTGTRSLWQELSFTITYESDWQAAEQILLEATHEIDTEKLVNQAKEEIRRMVGRFRVRFGALTPIVYVWPADSGVRLTLRHLTEARRQRIHRDIITRYVMRRFSENPHIQFAYPTQRIIPTLPPPAAGSRDPGPPEEPGPNPNAP